MIRALTLTLGPRHRRDLMPLAADLLEDGRPHFFGKVQPPEPAIAHRDAVLLGRLLADPSGHLVHHCPDARCLADPDKVGEIAAPQLGRDDRCSHVLESRGGVGDRPNRLQEPIDLIDPPGEIPGNFEVLLVRVSISRGGGE